MTGGTTRPITIRPMTGKADPMASPALVKKLLVPCPFPQGVAAGQRLKYGQYFEDWRADGFDITFSSFMNEALWKIAYAPARAHVSVILSHQTPVKSLGVALQW